MDTFDPSGYNCPQYVHFLNEDECEPQSLSDSYFDAVTPVQKNVLLKEQNNFTDSLKDAKEDAVTPVQKNILLQEQDNFTDSLMDAKEENKENQSSIINTEDEEFISSPIYSEELCRESYLFRITPARMKRRGTGVFSSSKKSKSRSVSIDAKMGLTRQLFDAQRVSTPFKADPGLNGELESFSKINEDGELQNLSLGSQQDSTQEEEKTLDMKRVTRSSLRLNEKSCNSSFRNSISNSNISSGFENVENHVFESVSLPHDGCTNISMSEMDQTEESEGANLTQDPKIFPVKYSTDSFENNANEGRRLTRSHSNSLPNISEMDQTQESVGANLTQDPKMFPVQYLRDSCENNDKFENQRTTRSRSNSVTSSEKPISSQALVRPITRVQPFNFTESRNTNKRKCEETEEYLPMAEQVAKFQSKTPQRFHSTANRVFQPTVHWSPHLVIPQSPNLQACKRIRGRTVLSRKELEDKEVEDMKQYKFQARPFNPKLIRPQQKQKTHQKTLTKPKGTKLHTSERTEAQNKFNENMEEKYEFHAIPLPKHILDGPVGLKEKKVIPPTVPESPMFALKERNIKWQAVHKLREKTPKQKVFKFTAKPSDRSVRPKVKYEPKRCTEIQPFSFDQTDKIRFTRKEEKIKKEIEKETSITQFRAHPLPSPLPSKLPRVPKKEITKPIPFNFQMEQSAEKKKRSFLEEDKYEFKAQPATVLTKEPFVPVKAITHLPVEEFTLHTDIRAAERLQLKEIQDAQNAERQQEYLKRQEFEAERERLEIQELRKQLVHKAQPIRQYKPMEYKSSRKVTEPVSPDFATNTRFGARH